MERFSAYWLSGLSYLGPAKLNQLLRITGSFDAAMNIREKLLWTLEFLSDDEKYAFIEDRKNSELQKNEFEEMLNKGIRIILNSDRDYPEKLSYITNPPPMIYVKGSLPDPKKHAVAIVGARNCTSYGKMLSEHYGKELARHGIEIISGMAYGIDSASHRGALEGKGNTYAVLGNGVDLCYPPSNIKLYMNIAEHGGIISEYAPGTPAFKWHFPFRNRIISGLSDLVLIIEAREKSGSLITADFALNQGKDVYAVPGRPDNPLNSGCNFLISQGAGIALSPESILDYFGIKKTEEEKIICQKINTLENREKLVYSVIDFKQRSTEEIMSKTALPFGECMEALFNLESDGLIIQPTNHYYIRKLE